MELVEVNLERKLSYKIWTPLVMLDPKRNLLQEAKELEAKWAKTGLLDAIEDKFKRQVCAAMLENQRSMNEKSI